MHISKSQYNEDLNRRVEKLPTVPIIGVIKLPKNVLFVNLQIQSQALQAVKHWRNCNDTFFSCDAERPLRRRSHDFNMVTFPFDARDSSIEKSVLSELIPRSVVNVLVGIRSRPHKWDPIWKQCGNDALAEVLENVYRLLSEDIACALRELSGRQ